MIVAEELLSREWKCFEHLARKLEGNHISLPKLERPSSGSKYREENRILVVHLILVVRISHSMEMVDQPRLVRCLKLTAPRENVRGSIQRYLWACLAYAAVTPAVGISNRCCSPSVPRSHILSDFIYSPHFSFRA